MTQSDIKIVPATRGNIDQIIKISKEAISADWTMNFLFIELDRKDAYFIAAKSDKEILGFAVFREVGDDGELLQIATRKDARQGGIGSVLLDSVLCHARDKSIGKVFLEVRQSNAVAIRLYEKFGFKALRVRKEYYNNPIEDALVMVFEEVGDHR